MDAIDNPKLIEDTCKITGKDIINIGLDEMENFCGNVIQLSD
jgi:hypothetical protein